VRKPAVGAVQAIPRLRCGIPAGTRRIGVLKFIGFSPPQVVAGYALQVAVPAAIGCAAGVAAGNGPAVPMLGQTAQVYGVGSLGAPVWVSVAVPSAMLCLVAVTAVPIALRREDERRAGDRGRARAAPEAWLRHAPAARPGRQLPQPVTIGLAGPVTIGLAGPLARPTRTLVTLAAIVFGVTAVIFAAGLRTSLNWVQADLSHAAPEQVQILLGGHQGLVLINGQSAAKLSLAAQKHAVQVN
jgi:putative ABC transport system permease protein